MVPYKFELTPGLPPDGESGWFIGFEDNCWRPHLLKWSNDRSCWVACTITMGPSPEVRVTSILFTVGLIAYWAPLPLVEAV